jgi:hypothetical protein
VRNIQIAARLAALGGLALLAGCNLHLNSSSSKPPAPAGLSAQPAEKILSEATTAAEAAGWMHIRTTFKLGPQSITTSGEAGPSVGREVIAITGGGQATIMLVRKVGYVRGNAAALTAVLGLPAADARGHRWIAFRPGDPGYQQVARGLTMSSFLSEIMPTGSLTKTGPKTLDGQSVIELRGKAPAAAGMPAGATDTLFVAATGRPLPVGCVVGKGKADINALFSEWGQAVRVTKPRHSVASSSGSGSA